MAPTDVENGKMDLLSSVWVAIFFIALGAAGAVVGAMQANKSEKQRADFEHALREKAETIADLQTELRQTMTGGDTFCYAHLDIDTGLLTVISVGDYPLYGLQLRLVNLDEPIPMTLESLNKNVVQMGDLPPRTVNSIQLRVSAPSGSVRWNLFFGARNGHWNQALRLRKIDGVWESAIRVVKFTIPDETAAENNSQQTILLEKISQKFPRTNGTVNWD